MCFGKRLEGSLASRARLQVQDWRQRAPGVQIREVYKSARCINIQSRSRRDRASETTAPSQGSSSLSLSLSRETRVLGKIRSGLCESGWRSFGGPPIKGPTTVPTEHSVVVFYRVQTEQVKGRTRWRVFWKSHTRCECVGKLSIVQIRLETDPYEFENETPNRYCVRCGAEKGSPTLQARSQNQEGRHPRPRERRRACVSKNEARRVV